MRLGTSSEALFFWGKQRTWEGDGFFGERVYFSGFFKGKISQDTPFGKAASRAGEENHGHQEIEIFLTQVFGRCPGTNKQQLQGALGTMHKKKNTGKNSATGSEH